MPIIFALLGASLNYYFHEKEEYTSSISKKISFFNLSILFDDFIVVTSNTNRHTWLIDFEKVEKFNGAPEDVRLCGQYLIAAYKKIKLGLICYVDQSLVKISLISKLFFNTYTEFLKNNRIRAFY